MVSHTLLFLARQPLQGGKNAWHATAARAFDERPVLERTREVLARHGSPLKLEAFEFTSLAEQQRAFASARIIVGAHGTGWSGLAFARSNVVIIEWAFLRDSWTIAEYLGLNATYLQLKPHWFDHPSVQPCNESHLMDDCPWHLDASDLETYATLLEAAVVSPADLEGAAQHRPGSVDARGAITHRASAQPRVRSEWEGELGVRSARLTV